MAALSQYLDIKYKSFYKKFPHSLLISSQTLQIDQFWLFDLVYSYGAYKTLQTKRLHKTEHNIRFHNLISVLLLFIPPILVSYNLLI